MRSPRRQAHNHCYIEIVHKTNTHTQRKIVRKASLIERPSKSRRIATEGVWAKGCGWVGGWVDGHQGKIVHGFPQRVCLVTHGRRPTGCPLQRRRQRHWCSNGLSNGDTCAPREGGCPPPLKPRCARAATLAGTSASHWKLEQPARVATKDGRSSLLVEGGLGPGTNHCELVTVLTM